MMAWGIAASCKGSSAQLYKGGAGPNSLPIGAGNTDHPRILPRILSLPGGSRGVEKALHENEIEPATELVADLPEVGDALKPHALVKTDRGIIRRIYAADHDVLPKAESQRK